MKIVSRLLMAFLAAVSVILAVTMLIDLSHLPSIDGLKHSNPKTTALMEQLFREAKRRGRDYKTVRYFVPYADISPHLVHAVLVAEDAAFFSHSGVDFAEFRQAFKENWEKKRFARDASTITMQLCKNLYLSTAKTPARKLSEFILARRMDEVLTKRRILELYLNYIEWGDGIFGCQAASRAYFGCQASDLTPEQAVRLASTIVNPRHWGPYSDTKRMNRRRKTIAEKMFRAGYLTIEEYQALPF